MTEKRLIDMTILSIENDLVDTICLDDDVVTEFKGKDKQNNHVVLVS